MKKIFAPLAPMIIGLIALPTASFSESGALSQACAINVGWVGTPAIVQSGSDALAAADSSLATRLIAAASADMALEQEGEAQPQRIAAKACGVSAADPYQLAQN